jgi:hypothetical protein
MAFGGGGVSMGNGERSGSGGRSDWPIRIAGMVGTAAGLGGVMLVAAWADLRGRGWGGLWVGLILVAVGISVGLVLGRLVGGLLFRPPSGGPPDGDKGAS